MIAGGIGPDTLLGLGGNDTIIRGPATDSIGRRGLGNDLILQTEHGWRRHGQRPGRGGRQHGGFLDFGRGAVGFHDHPYQGGETTLSGGQAAHRFCINVEFAHLRRGDPVAGPFNAGAPALPPDNLLGSSRRRDDRRPRRGGHDPGGRKRGARHDPRGPGLDLIFGGTGDDELRGNLKRRHDPRAAAGSTRIYGQFRLRTVFHGGHVPPTRSTAGNQDDQIWG